MRVFVLLLAIPLWAAEDANTIVKRLIAAQPPNEKRAQQYTYVQRTQRFVFDKAGKERPTTSQTHEVIFVEGLKYNKLIAKNERPLNKSERAKEEKAMRETAEYRRTHERQFAPGGIVSSRGFFTRKTADLGSLRELLTLFDNKLVGEEEIRGHRAWVIESTPAEGHEPASSHEKQVLGFSKKFWIDQTDNVLVRSVYTTLVPDGVMGTGSTLTTEYEKIDADTWQPITLILDFSKPNATTFRQVGRTLYSMSQFRKFNVESTITVEENK